MMTKVQLPPSRRSTFSANITIEKLLPLPCVCQKTPRRPLVLANLLHRLDGAVHAEHLMILGDELAQPAPRILEQQEALDEVEKARGFAGGAQHRLQRDALGSILLQPLPRREVLECGVARPHQRFAARSREWRSR